MTPITMIGNFGFGNVISSSVFIMPVKHEFLFSSYKSSTQNLKIPTRDARLLFPPPSWRLYQRVTEQLQVRFFSVLVLCTQVNMMFVMLL
jgi:hypothetical protein